MVARKPQATLFFFAGQFKWIRANRDEVPETEYTVRGLKEDQIYEFRIAAENKAGVGPCSENTQPVKAEEKVGTFPRQRDHTVSVYIPLQAPGDFAEDGVVRETDMRASVCVYVCVCERER